MNIQPYLVYAGANIPRAFYTIREAIRYCKAKSKEIKGVQFKIFDTIDGETFTQYENGELL